MPNLPSVDIANTLSEHEIDELIGQCLGVGSLYSSDDSTGYVERAKSWFNRNKRSIALIARDNPEIKEFFSLPKRERNEILAALGDIPIVIFSGIPVLLIIAKISHYGYDALISILEKEDEA